MSSLPSALGEAFLAIFAPMLLGFAIGYLIGRVRKPAGWAALGGALGGIGGNWAGISVYWMRAPTDGGLAPSYYPAYEFGGATVGAIVLAVGVRLLARRRRAPSPTSAFIMLMCAAVASILLLGRYGTIIGRYERIEEGMSKEQVLELLGTPTETIISERDVGWGESCRWNEGPITVGVFFDGFLVGPDGVRTPIPGVGGKHYREHNWGNFTFWKLRRASEKVWLRMQGRKTGSFG